MESDDRSSLLAKKQQRSINLQDNLGDDGKAAAPGLWLESALSFSVLFFSFSDLFILYFFTNIF